MRASDATRIYFDRAADELDLSASMRLLLATPEREVTVQLPVERDSGELATFIGYRVQHNDARGPFSRGACGTTRGSTSTTSGRWPL